MRFTGIALMFLFISGCTTHPTKFDTTSIEVEIGYSDVYSSAKGKYSRYICATQTEESVSHRLSESQLYAIGEIAMRTGFFELPSQLPSIPDAEGRIYVTAPCPDYSLNIYSSGQVHRVWWSCNEVTNGEHPKQVKELYNYITEATKPAQKKLPDSECRYH